VSAIAYGRPGHLHRQILGAPRSEVALKRTAQAGSIWIAGMPRSWESSKAALVSWFPAGAGATAVANPAPGTNIGSTTPIRLTFSTPVQQALHGSKPALSPSTPGTWHSIDSHTIIFKPQDFGYGLGAKVTVGLPSGVRLSGAGSSTGTWNVPPGSTVRLQQLLAMLNYLPLRFTYKHGGVPLTPAAQEAAAIHPPAGTFSWRFDNVPSSLRSMWAPGALGVVTRGAVMRFQDDHGLSTDGVAGPSVWRALFTSVLTRHRSSFGYTFVSVDMSSPETLTLWHDGKNVITTPVNTGIPSRPTAPGTFPVFEHIRVGTMSGTNPDGSHYNDPGIQFISYFNGGDALHAFSRAQFGFPQSLGCVEMELGPAGTVWPYTPIGTLVHVA
jgi:peptidoglycan hydrolase-like protein with peptidoglycan-binding domain